MNAPKLGHFIVCTHSSCFKLFSFTERFRKWVKTKFVGLNPGYTWSTNSDGWEWNILNCPGGRCNCCQDGSILPVEVGRHRPVDPQSHHQQDSDGPKGSAEVCLSWEKNVDQTWKFNLLKKQILNAAKMGQFQFSFRTLTSLSVFKNKKCREQVCQNSNRYAGRPLNFNAGSREKFSSLFSHSTHHFFCFNKYLLNNFVQFHYSKTVLSDCVF